MRKRHERPFKRDGRSTETILQLLDRRSKQKRSKKTMVYCAKRTKMRRTIKATNKDEKRSYGRAIRVEVEVNDANDRPIALLRKKRAWCKTMTCVR